MYGLLVCNYRKFFALVCHLSGGPFLRLFVEKAMQNSDCKVSFAQKHTARRGGEGGGQAYLSPQSFFISLDVATPNIQGAT